VQGDLTEEYLTAFDVLILYREIDHASLAAFY